MAFLPKLNGFIIDVPNLIYKPHGGKREVFDTLTSASINNGAENLPINGGQGKFPLTIIPTNKTLEFQFECADFDSRLFAKANDTETVEETQVDRVIHGEYIVGIDNTIDLGEKVTDLESIEIPGLEKGGSASAGVFAADNSGENTKITFHTDIQAGTQIGVSFVRKEKSITTTIKTTHDTGHGEFWLEYPVYASAERGSGVQGVLVFHVFSAYVTALPGFNNSYKSASTHGATFTALDPRRPDKKMYELNYFPNK